MTEYMSFDTETTGFNILQGARPFLFVGSKCELHHAEIELKDGLPDGAIGIATKDSTPDFTSIKTLCTDNGERFRKALEDPNIIKIMHNAKFDVLMMHSIGIEVKGKIYDTMVAAHLLDENNSCSLKYCAEHYLGDRKQSDEINNWFISNKIKKADRNYADIPDEIIRPYAIADAELTYKLFFKLKPLLEEQDLWELFEQECNLVPCLKDMFLRGLKIDVNYFERIREEHVDRADRLEAAIYETAGCEFNILSSKQLAVILTESGIRVPLTEKGNPSVSKASLETMDHPLVKNILEYRHTMKFISTFIDSMLTKNVDGAIHCELWAQGTTTGRFSSSNPNMQNIPKADKTIRRGFVCREGYTNFYFDYSSQEYRVFLDYVKEEALIKKVNEENANFHDLILAELYEYVKDAADPRIQIKILNFMLIYGGGVNKLADLLNVSWNKADEIKREYFKKFTKVKPFLDLVNQTVKWKGYVRNKFNRRRRLSSSEGYKATNALVQGSCADYTKNRMLVVYEFLKPYKSNLILQIHDELVVEVHNTETHVVQKIKDIMERSHKWFKVNLDVDVEYTTTNWIEKQKWEPSTSDILKGFKYDAAYIVDATLDKYKEK